MAALAEEVSRLGRRLQSLAHGAAAAAGCDAPGSRRGGLKSPVGRAGNTSPARRYSELSSSPLRAGRRTTSSSFSSILFDMGPSGPVLAAERATAAASAGAGAETEAAAAEANGGGGVDSPLRSPLRRSSGSGRLPRGSPGTPTASARRKGLAATEPPGPLPRRARSFAGAQSPAHDLGWPSPDVGASAKSMGAFARGDIGFAFEHGGGGGGGGVGGGGGDDGIGGIGSGGDSIGSHVGGGGEGGGSSDDRRFDDARAWVPRRELQPDSTRWGPIVDLPCLTESGWPGGQSSADTASPTGRTLASLLPQDGLESDEEPFRRLRPFQVVQARPTAFSASPQPEPHTGGTGRRHRPPGLAV